MTNRLKFMALILLVLLSVTACSHQTSSKEQDEKWSDYKNFYTLSVHNTGEDESAEKYLEIAERSEKLFPLLEENVGAFVCDAYNYQSVDDDGTCLYTMNGLDYPSEIDPNGQSIRVSKNYFQYNPIETVDGSDLIERIIYDEFTLNILVPEKYQNMEEQIIEAYRENFYFEKVQATNDYNEMVGVNTILDVPEETLGINIIYVKDGQRYFTFRSDCAVPTDNWVEDPIVQIYTSNIHCNYVHSFMTQWVYYYSDKENANEAYEDIKDYVQNCGAADSIQKVLSVYEKNK